MSITVRIPSAISVEQRNQLQELGFNFGNLVITKSESLSYYEVNCPEGYEQRKISDNNFYLVFRPNQKSVASEIILIVTSEYKKGSEKIKELEYKIIVGPGKELSDYMQGLEVKRSEKRIGNEFKNKQYLGQINNR